MQKLLLTVFLFLPFISSYTQNGFDECFIVNVEQDTIFGLGRMDRGQQFMVFKGGDENNISTYETRQLLEVQFRDGRLFVPETVINKIIKGGILHKTEIIETRAEYFLEYLVEGRIDIYRLQDTGYDRYFISKEGLPFKELEFQEKYLRKNGRLYEYIDNDFKGYLRIFMADSEESWKSINKVKKVDEKVIVDLSVEYNRQFTDDQKCIDYTDLPDNFTDKFDWNSGEEKL